MASGDLIPRIYSNFRGVDFRGEEINLARSPDSLNVWRNYKKTDGIETRPGMKLLSQFSETVHGIFFYNDIMIVHRGTNLYSVDVEEKTRLYTGVEETKSEAFIYNNIWFFKDGVNYLQYDGETIKEVVGYIPTTSINRKPSTDETPNGGGATLEDVNLLSDWRINTFIGDGEGTYFHVDAQDLPYSAEDFKSGETTEQDLNDIEFTIDGKTYKTESTEDYQFQIADLEKGIFLISPAPPEPLTTGQANVSIKFKTRGNNKRNKINKCTLLQVFDNRVFFSGNPDYPNMMWHCSLNDPTYCSDLDYYNEGLDTAKVKGMVAGNNVLWVFKEPSQANTTVFYHTPTIDVEYGKIYPNTHSSIATGCVGKAINFNDDIIFFSDRGMEGISGDITTEQVIAHRSSLVDRKLTAEPNYKDMILKEWEGYLLVCIDNKIYLADSRAMFSNGNHGEYEWFYWELDKKITCAKVNKGILYLGTENGVYTLTDTTSDVESYWVTPKDKFKHPQYLKTTNKRGCVVEATGDITVYAKTEKTDFELIGEYKNITDAFVSRIKRKKFKDIQLKFHSNTRFSVETVTLECFIGGYIKR